MSAAPLPSGPIAVIGGTGQLGAALATRWVRAGLEVIIGSRDAAKAGAAAAALAASSGRPVLGMGNLAAARAGSMLVLAVPFSAQTETLNVIREATAGKVLLDTTVPLMPPKVMRVQLPAEGSAAVRAQALLGPAATVISAFHNVAASKLARDEPIACDVLVFGDGPEARGVGIALVQAAGLRGLQGGALVNSVAAEAMTSVLIFINKTYAADGAGVSITGALQGVRT